MKSAFRDCLRIVYWDFIREMKRKDTIVAMLLFSFVCLVIFSLAVPPDSATGAVPRVRAGLLWVLYLLAGTIGIDRAFRGDGGGKVLEGLLLAPIARLTVFHARLISTFCFVLAMEMIVLGAFCLVYTVALAASQALWLAALIAAASFGHVAAGITVSAITRAMPGGDVLLRILLFPLLIPLFWAAVDGTQDLFAGIEVDRRGIAIVIAFDAIYLAAGQLLFPAVVKDYDPG